MNGHVRVGRAVLIPADTSLPVHDVTVPLAFPGLNAATVGAGAYVEVVHPRGLHDLQRRTGVRMCLLVDDEGRLKDLPANPRAGALYGGTIAGDAWVLAEVQDDDGERDLASLPAAVPAGAVAVACALAARTTP